MVPIGVLMVWIQHYWKKTKENPLHYFKNERGFSIDYSVITSQL